MKYIILTLIIFMLVFTGCTNEIKTPPWTPEEIAEMKYEKCVPLIYYKWGK